MEGDLRQILLDVREGRITPAEAARRLDTAPVPAAAAPALDPDLAARNGAAGGPVPTDPSDVDRTSLGEPPDPSRSSAPPASAGADVPATPTDSTIADDLPGSGDHWAAATDRVDGSEGSGQSADAGALWTSGPEPSDARRDKAASGSTRAASAPVNAVAPASATTGIRVRAITRRVRIVGDPTISTVSVEGPHELRREGSVLVCESDRDLPFGDPSAFLPSGLGRFRVQHPGRAFSWNADLVVRVNPALEVDVDVTAGALTIQDVTRVRARVTAGSARVEDVRGPIDLHVVGGTAKVDMVMVGGDNRIRCDSGSVVLRLRRGSDVRFRPEAQLGRIVVDGAEGGREIAVGKGAGRLRAEVVMGSIQVEVDR